MKVLITGATGFVGKRLAQYLLEHTHHELILALHKNTFSGIFSENSNFTTVQLPSSQYAICDLTDIDVIIHLAAFVPMVDKLDTNLIAEMNVINVNATIELAKNAALSGVKRFIYLSSLKVNGEQTVLNKPFNADSLARPRTPYGASKRAAEEGLLALGSQHAIEVVIIRPPLVYGPGVKGNFSQMIHFLKNYKTKIPLPLGGLSKNKRSYIFVDNLVEIIMICMTSKQAVNQVFLVSDDEDISTTELIHRLSRHLNKKLNLFNLPQWLLKSIAVITRKTPQVRRLCDSLHVDIQKTKEMLDWHPKVNLNEGLKQMVEYNVAEINE